MIANKYKHRFQVRSADEATEGKMIVKGIAAIYNQPTLLEERNGKKYYEQILPGAFENANIDDVVMRYDHNDKIMARTSNGTLKVIPTEKGLEFEADLSGTEDGRKLYEEIRGKYITDMSFCFTPKKQSMRNVEGGVCCDIEEFDTIYDVSAVTYPAYDGTYIEARSKDFINFEKRAKQKRKIQILMEG